jgi:poly(A) polymerase
MTAPLSRRAVLAQAACASLVASAPAAVGANSGSGTGFQISYVAGGRDAAGRFMGGTEMRALAGHAGKLYAGNGYWEDRPGSEGRQGPQILVLDAPGARWRVDHDFDELLPNRRRRDLAVSALDEVRFVTDGAGKALSAPVSLLIAASWDISGTAQVFSRDDATGAWTAATLAQDPLIPGTLPQIRSFGTHRDRVTGVDLAFAGQDPRGVFSGVYDPAVPGRIRWRSTPELDLASVSSAGISGKNGYLRVSSFAECNDRLYAAVGQQIYERSDGAEPHWRLLYTNHNPGRISETGLRGLTAIASPVGGGEVLLAAVEGTAPRIVRVDPRDGSEATELDLADFLQQRWGMPVGYVIAAYNNMAKIHDPASGEALLIGIEAFIPLRAPIAAGHSLVDVGYGRLEAGGWYLVRRVNGHYDLRQLPALPGGSLVSVRAIRGSPFAQEAGWVYFAGYDANKAPAHNTAWIIRGPEAAAISER